MKIKIILVLILNQFPVTLFAQQLECCKSVKQIETNINGYWKFKDSHLNEQLRFEFKNGIGKFWIYKFDANNQFIEIQEIKQTLEIFETKSGFDLDWSNGRRLATSKIKLLNSTNMIFERGDGKLSEYYKMN